MKTLTIPTETIIELPALCDDKLIVKQQKSDGYVKNWFCEKITLEEYEQLLIDIKTKAVITLNLREGK